MEILIKQTEAGTHELAVAPSSEGEPQPSDGEVGLVMLRLAHTLLSRALEEAQAPPEKEESRIVIPTQAIPRHPSQGL